jgi:hypothetical protein
MSLIAMLHVAFATVQVSFLLDDTVACYYPVAAGSVPFLSFPVGIDFSFAACGWSFCVSSVWKMSCLHCSGILVVPLCRAIMIVAEQHSTVPSSRANVWRQTLSPTLMPRHQEKLGDLSTPDAFVS